MFLVRHIRSLINIVREAGEIAHSFHADDLNIQYKKDSTPLSDADLAVNDFIIAELNKLFPFVPIISEENSQEQNLNHAKANQFWLIDPIDGTKAFIKGKDEYTVNIAFIKNNRSIFGVIGVPAKGDIYYSLDGKAFREDREGEIYPLSASNRQSALKVVMSSRLKGSPAVEQVLEHYDVAEKKVVPSSLKLCMIAEGSADLSLGLAPVREWDIAAGEAIIKAAGGALLTLEGEEIIYGKSQDFIPPQHIAKNHAL